MLPQRRWFVVLPLVTVTTAGLMAATRSEVQGASCISVTQWVAEHRAELPTTYEEIIKYPVAYRKSILGVLTSEQRRAAWDKQYQIYLEAGFLSPEQARFVARARAVAKNVILADGHSLRERTDSAQVLTEKALQVLGRQLTHRIMYVLGPDDEGVANPAQEPAIFRTASLSTPRVPLPFVNCDCHLLQGGGVPSPPECNSPKNCSHSNPECENVTIFGCGTDGGFSCNGTCQG